MLLRVHFWFYYITGVHVSKQTAAPLSEFNQYRHLQLKRKSRFSHLLSLFIHLIIFDPTSMSGKICSKFCAIFGTSFENLFDPDHFSSGPFRGTPPCAWTFLNLYIMLVYCHLGLTPGSRFQNRVSINSHTGPLQQAQQQYISFSLCVSACPCFLFKEEAFESCTIPQRLPWRSILYVSCVFHHAWSATYQPSLHLVQSPYLDVVQPMSECLVLFSRTHLQR